MFSSSGSVQPFKYNGKELDTQKGLNWYDYGVRQYDATLGRWLAVDPLAEKMYTWSSYAYCFNNPIQLIDINGAIPTLYEAALIAKHVYGEKVELTASGRTDAGVHSFGQTANFKTNSNLDIELIAYSNENIEYIKNINDKDNIQVLNDSVVANSLLGTANTKVFAKDTINIDTVDNLSEIMNVNINIINKEIKTSYNKILAKADMAVNILYEIEDGSIKEAKKVIPIMGFIDMKDVSDEHICNVNYEIKNMVIKKQLNLKA